VRCRWPPGLTCGFAPAPAPHRVPLRGTHSTEHTDCHQVPSSPQKLPAFYVTWRCPALCVRTSNWAPSNPHKSAIHRKHSFQCYSPILAHVFRYSFTYPNENILCISERFHACSVPCQSHPSRFDILITSDEDRKF
jgi:hypothetical protein